MAPIRFGGALRIGVLAAAVLLLLLTALGRAVAETPDTITTQLKPGINFVGWVGPETPVADLFDDVPEIEAVYTWRWDGSRRTWLSASPRVPREFHSLETLTTGTGLVLSVSGTEVVEWERPLVLGSGFVWLARGFNLIPWVGAAGDTIQDARLDTRPWFLSAHVWDPVLTRYRTYDPQTPATVDALSQVKVGDALWIEVGEGSDGYWAQRSDSLSQIQGTLTGPEGEPFVNFGVTAIALDSNDNWFYDYTNSDGSFFIQARTGVPYILRFHHDDKPGCWLFYKDGLAVKDGQTASPLRADPANPASVMFQVPDAACGWEIRGQLVDADGSPLVGRKITVSHVGSPSRREAETAPDGSFTVLTDEDGPHRLRISLADGCVFLYRNGGVNTSAADASLIQIADAHVDGVTITVPADACRWWIRGTAVNSDGQPLAGLEIGSYRNRSMQGTTQIAADGSFSVPVLLNGLYELRIDLGDDCAAYYHPDGATDVYDQAESVQVRDGDVTGLQIVVPDKPCGLRIAGQVINRDAVAVDGFIQAIAEDRSAFTSFIRDDGSFTVTVPAHNTYRLELIPDDGCLLWHRDGGAVGERTEAPLIEVAEQDIVDLRIEVSEQACGAQVNGQLVGPQGEPLGGVQIEVFEHDAAPRISSHTSDDGSFSIFIRDGEIVSLWLDGCLGYYDGDDVASFREDAAPVRINDIDVTSFILRVPADACAWRITGNVLGSDGEPITDGEIGLVGDGASGSDMGMYPLGPDGSFDIAATVPGDYRLHVRINYCSLYFDGEAISTHLRESGHISVGGAHLDGINVRIPPDVCTSRVHGFIVDADGAALGDMYVVAQNYDGMAAAFTEADGSFEITVPTDGEYEVLIYADRDCWLYYSEQGSTAQREDAMWVRAGDGYDNALRIRVPENPCG